MKLITMAVVTLATASAFAAKSTTEYYNQPAAGAHNVDIGYLMGSNPGKTKTGTTETDAKTATSDVTLQYRYGINDDMAVGVSTNSGSVKTTVGTNDSTASGMTDLVIGLDGKSEAIHYGVDLGYNLGGKSKQNAAGEKSNRSSGGIGIGANVGYLATSDAWNFGGDLSYWHRLERTTDANGTDIKATGGNNTKVAGFGEYNYGMGFAGAELSYNMIGDTTAKTTPNETKYKGHSFMGIKAYGSYDFNDMATGLLSIAMNMHPEYDYQDAGTTKVMASTETVVALGARLTF